MGLDTSHNAWHGPYSAFNNFRRQLAKHYGIPLDLMQGFYTGDNGELGNVMTYPFYFAKQRLMDIEFSPIKRVEEYLPLKWEDFKPNAIHELLYHSDCEGYINWTSCGKIAKELNKLLSKLDKDEVKKPVEPQRAMYNGFYEAVKQFANGCQLAFDSKERLEFH